MRDSHLELNAVCEDSDDERPTTHVYTARKLEAVLPVISRDYKSSTRPVWSEMKKYQDLKSGLES